MAVVAVLRVLRVLVVRVVGSVDIVVVVRVLPGRVVADVGVVVLVVPFGGVLSIVVRLALFVYGGRHGGGQLIEDRVPLIDAGGREVILRCAVEMEHRRACAV